MIFKHCDPYDIFKKRKKPVKTVSLKLQEHHESSSHIDILLDFEYY